MKFVVIGASAAGVNAVQKLRELNPDDEIVLISKDTEIYSRCILYRYLEGTRTLEELNFAGFDFVKGMSITWLRGLEVTGVDINRNAVILDQGNEVYFDKLCIATGSHTNFPPIPGLREGNNIVGFRNLSDAAFVKEMLPDAEHIFVMGAGLVGIDVIAGLFPYHKKITLVDMGPYMMPVQLDRDTAKTYQDLFAAEGVKQYYNMGAKEFVLDENGSCYKVILHDHTEVPTDLVINCAGVRPNVEFLSGSGIECDRYGLLIDEYGKTNIENIYGAGDVTGRCPVWPAAVREGMIAAYSMSGIEKKLGDYFAEKSSMHFLDIPTISIGNVNHYDETYEEEIIKDELGNYKKIVSRDGIVAGALLQGDLTGSGKLAESVRKNGTV